MKLKAKSFPFASAKRMKILDLWISYPMPNSSTSKISVAFGGIAPG